MSRKSSSGDGRHPYLYSRVKSPISVKDYKINHCNDVYDRIKANWEAQRLKVQKTNGIEIK